LNLALDIILSDYSMPQFNAIQALQLLQERGLDVPFIIVSGSIGEDIAVTALQQGAADYLLKDRLGRLGEAVRHALEQKGHRDNRRRDAEALLERARLASMTADVGVALTRSDRLSDVLRLCTESMGRNLDAAFAGVWTLDDDRGVLQLHVNAGQHSFIDETRRQVPVGQTIIGAIAQQRSALLTNDVFNDPRFSDHDRLRHEGVVSFAGYPLIVANQLLGVIGVYARQVLSYSAGEALALVANLIALGIQRRRGDEALRAATDRLQHVVASSPAVLFTLAVKEDILPVAWVSDNVEEMMGYTPGEVYQPDWWLTLVHADDREQARNEIQQKLPSDGRLAHEYRFRHKDGVYRWMRSEMRLLRDTAGRPVEVVGSWSDITQRKLLEEQYRQAQKMEAVGVLAGGVAHDFNNLLTVINGYCEIVLTGMRVEDPLHLPLEEIQKAGNRAAGLTRQLLAFSRKQVLMPVVLDLNIVLVEMEKMLRRLIGEDVALTVSPAPHVWQVKADQGQIEQVVMNVMVNARDAMPDGGKLLIETKNVELSADYPRTHTGVKPGDYVLLAISDTGTGMDEAVQKRIFEPFFTTKGPNKGTGLGLATVFGIVKQSGGHIEVYSEVGHGTTFKIYLPRDTSGQPVTSISRNKSPVRGGSETILLVEDDEGVRKLALTVLREQGYNVLDARQGGDALRICETRSTPIDLLITDVIMPHVSGRELAERLAVRQPAMKVIFMSGYTDDAIVHHGVLESGIPFLQKPFAPETLARKVREVLDGPAKGKA
jgi:PAS domain S-box-containing protein